MIEERRAAVKASLSLGLNAAPCVKGSVKASGSASFHQAACAQELISGDGRLSGTSMLCNRRHSAASSLVLSGIAKAGAPVCPSVMPQSPRKRDKKALRGSAGNCRHKNTDFAQTLSLLCARREAGAIHSPRRHRSCVLERNTSERVRIRVEKELDYDLDAAGASV